LHIRIDTATDWHDHPATLYSGIGRFASPDGLAVASAAAFIDFVAETYRHGEAAK
jgi:hypothetical protein